MTAFSDTTNRNGIIELIERNTNTQSATNSSYPLAVKTSDVNDTLGFYFLKSIRASGRWEVDDNNQIDYPIMRTTLTSGQQSYAFLIDETGNQILDLYQVRVKDNNGNFHVIKMIDRTDFDISKYDGVTGVPIEYDLTSNGILLYPTPNYTVTTGLELYTARTPTYFTTSDTTKEAGIPKIFHPYLHLRPSYLYCAIKNLPQTKALQIQVQEMERAIEDYHSQRVRVEKPRLKIKQESTR